MKKLILLLCFLVPCLAAAGHSSLLKTPILIELEVVGTETAPHFQQEKIQFDVGNPYVLLIRNTMHFTVAFEYENFGQIVRTESLKGSNSVTQNSLILPPNSKVQWVFTPLEPAKINIQASNIGFKHKGKSSFIEIK